MEKLYNNVIFDDKFGISDPQDVPYLKEPPEVIDVTVGRQLFADDFLIAETELKPEYHKAKKYEGNPVFYAETNWEKETLSCACPKSGGVWYDEQDKIFKMWYEGSWLKHMCYAESKDGINWERPKLNGDGTLTTRKLTFKNKTDLYVNIDGKISAEILSDDGMVFAKSDTFGGNSTKARLRFDGLDIKSLNGKVIRLKFNVSGKLYSFGFADINGDFGGAHAAGCYEV